MVIEHIIAGYSIPHNEGAVPLTKEAYDVNNPQKRLTDFSKTITIPENKTVNQIFEHAFDVNIDLQTCLLYTSPSPRDRQKSRMPSSA